MILDACQVLRAILRNKLIVLEKMMPTDDEGFESVRSLTHLARYVWRYVAWFSDSRNTLVQIQPQPLSSQLVPKEE